MAKLFPPLLLLYFVAGIETSCDDTGAAVIDLQGKGVGVFAIGTFLEGEGVYFGINIQI